MAEPDTVQPFRLDPARVRSGFERAARTRDRYARVEREIGERLLEHLEPVRIAPRVVLDIGAGTGTQMRRLAARYRRAALVAIDFAQPMLAEARRKARRVFSRLSYVCADAARLPVGNGAADLLFSNLMVPWCDDPAALFREFARVVAPGGLVEFSSFGPDTLKELRESWAVADDSTHVHAFLDMHDVGDALLGAGLVDVVMDTERVTVEYPDVPSLLRTLRGLGVGNCAAGRPRGLIGRRRFERMREAYEARRTAGVLPVSLEVVYAHAWKPLPGGLEVPFGKFGSNGFSASLR